MLKNFILRGKILSPLLITQYKSGIFGKKQTPEYILPKGMKRGSRDHLRFITVIAPLSYIRNADELHRIAKKTFEDPATRFLFYPKAVLKKTVPQVYEALKRHGLGKRIHRETSSFIIPLSKNLVYLHDGDPYNLLSQYKFDALKIYEAMRGRFSNWFPYISGVKVICFYLREIASLGFPFKLKNLDKIDIPVDIHVLRATIKLGCITGKYEGPIEEVNDAVRAYWKEVCEEERFFPLQLDEPLWLLSRGGCKLSKESYCPKERMCYFARFCRNGVFEKSSDYLKIDT